MPSPIPLRFTSDEAEQAADEWKFNCGPGALCAVLGMKPSELRPRLIDFERKGYTNPSLMCAVLRGLRVPFYKRPDLLWPDFGLVRVQWEGPWSKPGVPPAAAYRHTHWVASCVRFGGRPDGVWDVNVGHWCSFSDWARVVVPWLLERCEPKATGNWWVTHSFEIEARRCIDCHHYTPRDSISGMCEVRHRWFVPDARCGLWTSSHEGVSDETDILGH